MTTKKKATDQVAEDNDIVADIVSDLVEEVVEDTVEQSNADKVISGPKQERRTPVSGTVTDDDGVIGSRGANKRQAAKVVEKEETPKVDPDKVAVWSPRHIHAARSMGVPSLQPGYNFMNRKQADIWISLKKDVREATPSEVAKHFGV